jgi:hypothetical protein
MKIERCSYNPYCLYATNKLPAWYIWLFNDYGTLLWFMNAPEQPTIDEVVKVVTKVVDMSNAHATPEALGVALGMRQTGDGTSYWNNRFVYDLYGSTAKAWRRMHET